MGIHARICLLSVALAAANAAAQAGGDILGVAKDIEGGKDVKGKVAAIRKKFDDLEDVMRAYKPRSKGGIGLGPVKAADGIEAKINALGKRALTKGALAMEQADLVRMGYINMALAKITHAYPPAKPNPRTKKNAADWRRHADEMEKESKALIDAVRKGDPTAVRRAAETLDRRCNLCHEDFRN